MTIKVGSMDGIELFRQSTDAAGMCKAIVMATARKIQNRSYVGVEGWQAIAIAHGCSASAGPVERIDDPACPGFRSIATIHRMDDGRAVSTAEGFVGDDEVIWSKRPVYARRAMAQTRGISRACRSAFAHVVVMMNAGLSTTPAEEVPEDGFPEDGRTVVVEQRPHRAPPQQEAARESAQALVGAAALADVLAAIAKATTRPDFVAIFPLIKTLSPADRPQARAAYEARWAAMAQAKPATTTTEELPQ